ncbi:MAG: anthranilate synthase component I family protein [Micrococcales bacterium]
MSNLIVVPLYYDEFAGWAAPADVFVLLHKGDENAFWLDRENHWGSRFSVIGASHKLHRGDGLATLHAGLEPQQVVDLPFEFRPGLVGALAYDGDSYFMHVDRAIVFDHDAKGFWLIGEFENTDAYDAWKQAALLRIGLCGGEQAGYRLFHGPLRAGAIHARHTQAEYLALIDSAKDAIARGEVYQLCLTNQLRFEVTGHALTTFMQLRETNPAPYAGYFKFGAKELVCFSPEQFLHVERDGHVSTKPIKGTRPRHADAATDVAIAAELAANVKERAENLMIVDLMRNDIGSVSQPQSVAVTKLFDIESYASVHQLVSTVEAQLAEGKTAVDATEAAFPGGSMTGAPKQRAIELIDQLESTPDHRGRGIYSGVAGYLTHGGVADFGMVIRSMIIEGGHGYIGVGGGITSDSIREEEFEEIKLKAKALLDVLGTGYPSA